jgi:regulator of replication initiation timing
MQLKTFDKNKTVIVVCENENISNAAAFLFLRNKFKALIIKGGMKTVPEDSLERQSEISIEDSIGTNGTTENSAEFNQSLKSVFEPQSVTDISIEENIQQNPLQLENQELKQKIQKLITEKSEQEKKYQHLYKQAEKFKASLHALKNKGEGTQ